MIREYIIKISDEIMEEEIADRPKELVRCKDCVNCIKELNGDLYCDVLAIGYEPLGSKRVTEGWYCADGERKKKYDE